MMNVLSDILCDTSSIMAPQNFKETLSRNKIISQNMASKQGSLHLLGSSQISAMERPMTSTNHTNLDIYNAQNQIHMSSNIQTGFDASNDVSVFSDSFPEMVPSWLTNDFMKTSESLSSPGILSNVPDIYPSRQNEHLEMLDLGFSPELTSHDVSSNELNQSCMTEGQKLLMELPIQRFSSNDSLLIPSFNGINVNEINTMQYQKFKQNPPQIPNNQMINSVLPCESDLLHLPLHSNLTDQCLTTTSSPSMMSNSQSQSHPVDVCDKLPHINLNNLDSFLGSENALSEIQLLPQTFPSVDMPGEVNCNQSNQSCLNNCVPESHGIPCEPGSFLNPNTAPLSSTQDISVQVSESALNENLLENQCFSCSQVNPNAAIDIVQCYKCKFCDYINMHKCAIENHINTMHSTPQNILPVTKSDLSSSGPSTVVSSSSISIAEPNQMRLSESNSAASTTTVVLPLNASINNVVVSLPNNIIQNTESYQCMNCNKVFSHAVSYKSHSLSCHNLNPESTQNIVQNAEHLQCIKCGKLFSDAIIYATHLVTDHNIDPKSVLISNQSISSGYSSNTSQIETMSGIYNSNVALKYLNNNGKSDAKQSVLTKKRPVLIPKNGISPNIINPLQNGNGPHADGILGSNDLSASQPDMINSKSNSKPRLLPKRTEDPAPKSNTKKTNNEISSSNGSEKQISSHKIAWKKKFQRELGSYICEFKGCNVRFRALDNLEYHNKCHASGGSFACPECGCTFEKWGGLAGHLWRNHKNDMELHACDQCPFRTHSLSRLENIHKKIHLDECLFLCDTCGKKFKNGKQMRNHRAIHFNKPKVKSAVSRDFKCKVCSNHFLSKVLLRHHLDTVHNIKPKIYVCNFCEYTSHKRSTFEMHMRKHTGEKPFKCDQCDYCTSDHNSLRRHKMKHSGEKKYKCPYCPYSAIQASTFKSHLKKHPGHNDLMFSCKICTFQTLKEETFVQHMKDHESLKVLEKVNSLSEMNSTEDTFPLAEAMDITFSHGDNNLIPYLNKDRNMQSFFNNLGVNMVSVCQESAT
ncbi:zinc finger protein 836-like [Argiope bruennichi]|uniref:Zinc finger protein 62 like protein n=1 Tax=Argiope bruennichi TaxID=94029 RepID=A0A8T0F1C9_ARGBR|nr:zinc finger protein 836-like [Argiope bruennichi]KAF8782789.1 Zinc finger protein 62 like protein [Argiope bruennichi]